MREPRRRLRLLLVAAALAAGATGRLIAQERWENPVMRAGHAAFGAGRYDEALEHYRRQQLDGMRLGLVENWLPELIETVERRRALGQPAPADTHRIGVIFVRENVEVGAGGARRTRPDVTDEHKALWRTYLASLSRLVETWSNGGLTLAFHEVDAVATRLAGDTTAPYLAEHLDLERWFAGHVDDLDSYITFSLTTTAHAGSDRYPLVSGAVSGPDRGFVGLNPRHDWTIMVHEFFHVIEAVSGIRPMHGYRDSLRGRIPEWTGATEFDYYRWRYATTLAPRWNRLNYRARWVAMPPPVREPALQRIRPVYDTIPLARRRAGRVLADSARRFSGAGGDTSQVRRLYEQALQLSPYDPVALRDIDGLTRRLRSTSPWSVQVATLKDAEEFIDVDRVREYGRIVGTWRPPQIRQAGAELSWDVTPAVAVAGTWDVTLWYRDGWSAVRTAWVALLEDGREVARDVHEGRSGERRENITYGLTLAERRPGATYTVRAKVYGLGGEDSNGLVLVRRRP